MSRIKELIKKLWDGNLTSVESNELNNLINYKDADFRNELEKEFYLATASKEQQLEISRPSKVIYLWRHSWKVAASLIIGTLLVQLFFHQHDKSTEHQLVTSRKASTTPISELVTRVNNTEIDMLINLSDGSQVILSSGSSIQYLKLFDFDKRNVTLTGKAYFKVKKNPAKPFSVLTGIFATTALGTEFEVNTLGDHKLVVKLFTVKVKVYTTDKNISFDAVFLTPRQLVSINTKDRSVNDRSEFKLVEKQLTKAVVPLKKVSNLNFENKTLGQVFDILSTVYNIPIEYNKEQIEGLYFTGSVLQTDSIINIINLIANMNELVVLHNGEHIVIQKK